MILRIHIYASFLSVSTVRSRAGEFFCLSSVNLSEKITGNLEYTTTLPPINCTVHVLYQILKNIMASIAELETDSIFLNAQVVVP